VQDKILTAEPKHGSYGGKVLPLDGDRWLRLDCGRKKNNQRGGRWLQCFNDWNFLKWVR